MAAYGGRLGEGQVKTGSPALGELSGLLGLRPPLPGLGDRWFLSLLFAGIAVGLALGWYSASGGGDGASPTPWFWLWVVVYYPVLEELLFRGVLQGSLLRWGCWSRKSFAAISGANLLSSLAFCGLHLVYQPPLWALAVFVPSLAFGYARDRQQSVLGALVLHSIWNGSFFLAREASRMIA
jgi:membrane protease YdiL (CAAX protease family)